MLNQNCLLHRCEDLVRGARGAMAFLTLGELGIFEQLCKAPQSAKSLSDGCSASAKKLRQFLDLMVALRIIDKTGDHYCISEQSQDLFLPGGELWQRFQSSTPGFFRQLAKASEAFPQGEVLTVAGNGGEVDEEKRREFLTYLHRRSLRVAQEMAEKLSGRAPKFILDLGCGAGTYTWAFLNTLADAKAVLIDRPNAESLVNEIGAEQGFEGRYEFRGIDFFSDNLGADYDLILCSNITHCFGATENRLLFERCAQSLSPGGALAVKDFFIEDDLTAPYEAANFSVLMASVTEDGEVYPESTLKEFGACAGLHFHSSEALQAAPEAKLYLFEKPGAG